jgi:hypothetical protein
MPQDNSSVADDYQFIYFFRMSQEHYFPEPGFNPDIADGFSDGEFTDGNIHGDFMQIHIVKLHVQFFIHITMRSFLIKQTCQRHYEQNQTRQQKTGTDDKSQHI